MAKAMTSKQLESLEKKVVKKAKDGGVDQNYLFVTTFDRYKQQLKYIEDLENDVAEEGTIVTKEYVKGRCNKYVSPSLAALQKMYQTANQTAQTLTKIIKELGDGDSKKKDEVDEFLDFVKR